MELLNCKGKNWKKFKKNKNGFSYQFPVLQDSISCFLFMGEWINLSMLKAHSLQTNLERNNDTGSKSPKILAATSGKYAKWNSFAYKSGNPCWKSCTKSLSLFSPSVCRILTIFGWELLRSKLRCLNPRFLFWICVLTDFFVVIIDGILGKWISRLAMTGNGMAAWDSGWTIKMQSWKKNVKNRQNEGFSFNKTENEF